MLRDGFGHLSIEDLWHRYFCVSSNLTKGHLQVHTTGPVWQAVRASISIPGLFPPVNSGNGDVLVDGAVMNNLPVDVMRSLNGGGPVLAVSLRGEFSLRSEDLPHHGVLSGWRVFGRRFNPGTPRSGRHLAPHDRGGQRAVFQDDGAASRSGVPSSGQ